MRIREPRSVLHLASRGLALDNGEDMLERADIAQRDPPMSVRVRVPACNAHFLKCRRRRPRHHGAGDLCEEPVTFRGSA
jgi:hypothetical protein